MEVIAITNRWTEALLYSGEHVDVKEAVEAAVNGDADLGGADLRGADLRGAYLTCADLRDADLRGAYLRDADLRGADLRGAYLTCADLRVADLRGADLRGADLRGAKVGAGEGEARLAGSRPIVQIGPIGSRDDWLAVFWCGDAGLRISTGCQQQITEEYFLERLAEAHGEGEQANIHAKHYIESLAFAKRLLVCQQDDGWLISSGRA